MPTKPSKKKTTKPKQHITKDMTIGEAVQKHPESAVVMMAYGLHCIGCHVAAYETIEQGCKGHGLDDKEIDKMIDDINKAIEKHK